MNYKTIFITLTLLLLPLNLFGAAGDTDLSFNPAGITNVSTVNDVVVQPDGKILVAGVFTRMNGEPAGGISRLNADGTIDTTFAPASGANGAINVIALQADGKILIGGAFTNFNGTTTNGLARLNADGSLDTLTFNIGTGFIGAVNDIAVQPADNKIVVVGNFTSVNGTTINRIARLNTDGSLDSANFNPGTGSPNLIRSVAVEAGGTILIGGEFIVFNGATRNRIARLGADGTLDAAFTPSINNFVYAIELQTNGQILIGGAFTNITGVGGVATARNSLARLNADGSLDSSFNANVVGSGIFDLAIQSDGSIVFTGAGVSSVGGQPRRGIGRVFGSGAVDNSYTARFNDGTIVNNAVAVQANDSAIYGGFFQLAGLTTVSTKLCASLLRVNSDGSIDQNFNAAAGASVNFFPGVREIFVRSNGKILVGGNFAAVGRFSARDITQFNDDGSVDETFNAGGFGSSGQNANGVFALAEQPDGKILVGGEFTDFNLTARNAVVRLEADGTIDTSFTSGFAPGFRVNDIEVLPDGRVVMVGNFSTYSGQPRNRIVVVNADGSLDTTIFNNSGTGANSEINAVEVDANGKFLIAGNVNFTSYNGTPRNRIARLNADGSLDPTFMGAGANATIEAMELQPDGSIVIGGQISSYDGVNRRRIARANADGTIDTSFVPAESGANSVSADVLAVALQADGKILIGGNFTTPEFRIARLNVDGSLDTSFNPPSGANDAVYSVAVQADRKILIGGAFTSVNGATRLGIARLEPGEPILWNGSVSTDWNMAANWTPAQVPTLQDAVLIPAAAPNNPVIGGTFSVNTLTVEAGKTATINGSLTTASLFNNGTINGAGTLILGGLTNVNNGTISVADPRNTLNGRPRISGAGAFTTNFTINNGILELGSNHQFSTVSGGGGSLDIRTFNLRVNGAGNPLNNTGGVFCSGGCRIEFNGTSPQILNGNQATGFLTINNPAGVTLTNNPTITENLTLTSGIFNTGAFTVTLDSDATLTRTNGYVVGNLRKEFTAGAGDFTFAVGTANGYSPVTLGGIVGTGDFTVRANEGAYPNAATNLPINRAARWWRLTNNGLTEADVSFNYLSGDITLGTESEYRPWRIPTGGGTATQVPGSINTTTRIVSAPNVQTFSDWTLAQATATAANVHLGGRITANGRGLPRVSVTLTDTATGENHSAVTNSFGYYRFAEIAAGRNYVVAPRHKQHQFAPRVVFVAEEIADFDFESNQADLKGENK